MDQFNLTWNLIKDLRTQLIGSPWHYLVNCSNQPKMYSQADAFDIDVASYLSLAGFVILYYDYGLTFRMEISAFWSPLQYDWGTTVFLLNRYITLLGHLPVVAEMFLFHLTEKTCHTLRTYHSCLAIIIQILAGVIMVTRTYALWGCSRKILSFLVIIAVVVIFFGTWSLFSNNSHLIMHYGLNGCQVAISANQGHHIAISWAGIVSFDTIIFALTVYKSLKLKRISYIRMVDVFLRDGAIYFGVIGAMALCNVFLLGFGRQFSRMTLTIMTNVISSIAATRLMLNIRQRVQKKVWLSGSLPVPTVTTATTIQFAPGPAFVDPESSYRPQQFVENELKETKQDDLELLPLGELARIQLTA